MSTHPAIGWILAAVFGAACSSTPRTPGGAGDAAPMPSDGDIVDAAPIPPFDPGPTPTGPLDPRFGELTVLQLHLPAGPLLRMGEAAIIVGPDGTLVLLDAGNARHDTDVRDELRRLNTQVLTPAHGYPARSPLQVDWVVLTHFHGDHIGGMAGLLDPAKGAITVTHGIIHRGFVDLGPAIAEDDYAALCTALRGSSAAHDVALCSGAVVAPCDAAQFTGAYPASGCPGLFRGDLADPDDDATGAPSFLALGGGARLTLIGASGFVSDGHAAVPAPPFAHDQSNQENARSVIGLVTFGAFRYHFAGDLTGRGDVESPDIEAHLVAVGGPTWYGARGVDVTHSHHHARRTSNNAAMVDLVTPSDGRSRNVVAGINEGYLGSPYEEVLAGFAAQARLGDGWFWVTDVTTGGGAHARMIDAAGRVIVETVQHGRGYWMQAAGSQVRSSAYPSVAAEP